jgi:putative oxidoreductase
MKNQKYLNIGLWVAQILVAAVLIMAGLMKLTTPISELSKTLPWTGELPELFVRAISLIDIAGGLGLILPSALRIKPNLTAAATIGVILLMVCAIVMHVSKGEASLTGINYIIIALAGFVYWGRTKKVVIQPK